MNPCGCGCGEQVTRRFKPGHDMRLKGALLRAYRAGGPGAEEAKIRILDEGWGKYIDVESAPMDHPSRSRVPVQALRTDYSAIEREKASARLARLATLKAAACVLKEAGRYGVKSGDGYIMLDGSVADAIVALGPKKLAAKTRAGAWKIQRADLV